MKGSLEKHLLIGTMMYNELIKRGIKVELPKEFDEFMNIVEKGKTGIMSDSPDFDLWSRWYQLVNMSAPELKKFMDSEEGKKAGLTKEEAAKQGIKSGRESAEWLLKMIPIGQSWKSVKENWTDTMWEWAGRQNSFISRMRGAKGPIYEKDGKTKTRKHLSLLIWGHNPKKPLKEAPNKPNELAEKEPGDDFGETRKEAADKFWKTNWHNMFPKDGKGRFSYQHHWRGLTKEEADKMSDEELLNTKHSIHGDLRFEVSPKELFGFTVFTGTAEDNKKADGDKLVWQSEHKKDPSKLQGDFKLAIPYSWLDVGKGKGTISVPRGVGATEKKWAKFFLFDKGTYEMGVARKHMREVFLNGKKMKGRMIFQYAPVGEGRKWLVDFPEDQTPIADKRKLEDVIKEVKKKGRRWLIWAKPGMKPNRIDVEKWKEKEA